MEIFKLIQRLENDYPTKLSRLLILIYELSGVNQKKGINNISKLAKLDFLMTSPVMLRRIIDKPNALKKIEILPYDNNSIESQYSFYRYNPWSTAYRGLLNTLISTGLISIEIDKLSYEIKITERGVNVVNTLYEQSSFKEYRVRAKLINTNLGNYSNNFIRSFFEKKFPELSNLNQDNYEDTF